MRACDIVVGSCHPKHTHLLTSLQPSLTQYTTISRTFVQWTKSFSQVIVGFWEIREGRGLTKPYFFNSWSCIKSWSLEDKASCGLSSRHNDPQYDDSCTNWERRIACSSVCTAMLTDCSWQQYSFGGTWSEVKWSEVKWSECTVMGGTGRSHIHFYNTNT